MRLPWLKASPSAAGGSQSTAVELRRLRELEAAGVLVPKVLAHTDNAILMQDVAVGLQRSESLEQMIVSSFANGQTERALGYWHQGLLALSALHRKDLYLSQAFCRNMVLCASEQVGFVDFEDDPLEVMDLLDCKVRDVLCYLHSTAWPIAQAQALPQAQAMLSQWVLAYGSAERAAFQAAARRVRFTRWFPNDRRCGKDVVRIRNLYGLVSMLARPESS